MIKYGSGFIVIEKNWADFKSIVSSKTILVQYETSSGKYEIFAIDNSIVYTTYIYTGTVPSDSEINQATNDSNKSDFETNFLPDANQSVAPKIVGGVLKVDGAANIFRTNELVITTKTETDISNTTYTVPAGKKFSVTSFIASYDSPSVIIVRLKKQVAGAGPFSTLFKIALQVGGQGQSTAPINLSAGVSLGNPTDVFKVTAESALIKGTVWASYAGIEL